ncbi:GNAT family N-acetyltransferase [Azomonas macrocytogenes]|uniref:GNAT family N-acetyltransferase n=1 Tax=Azomonas macrocytogenes TaxID=69962 RepID=A0A839SZT4_AZOMA|nr:GNAT family N-acetyltransferase [Azomonas macrocytogenes]MBB3102662.1 hypothetical protein [Azomonas macrocytogenes]
MLQYLRFWRERGWTAIDSAAYAEAWRRLGGSVITHPDIVERLATLVGIPVRYLGWQQGGELVAAIPCWGRHLALSKEVLKQAGKKRFFDLGNAEVILPIAEHACVPVRQQIPYVSEVNKARIATLRAQSDELAFARPPENYKGRYRYNLRRDLRLIKEAGGEVRPIGEFATLERARIYAQLFEKRWKFEVPGKANLVEVFDLLQEFMAGSVVLLEGRPIAIQILYRVESPQWISMEYINGGFDPDCDKYAPGSVLTFVNTQAAWDEARALGKQLRYSFGRADREYKDLWCHRAPVYQV